MSRVGSTVTLSAEVGSIDFTNSNTCTFSVFGRLPTGLYFDGRFQGITTLSRVGDVRTYDVDFSAPATGTPVLIDTTSGLNATGVNMPTDGSAWIDLGGGGTTLTVTESKSSRLDLSLVSIVGNIAVSVTEYKSSRVDVSSLSISGAVVASVTEVRSKRDDSSSVTIESKALDLIVTEIKKSRVDISSVAIKKEIEAIVTEVKASRNDLSNINIPVIITVNAKNTVKIKRKTNLVKVKRKTNIVRVK